MSPQLIVSGYADLSETAQKRPSQTPLDQECPICACMESFLRRRVIANGSVQYLFQCATCGHARGSPIRHSDLPSGRTVSAWDDSLYPAYEKQRQLQYKQQRSAEHAEWLKEHDAYLATPEWKARRRLVMERAGGLCEGCRSEPAVHVHHLSYEHWKKELLWELVAVCVPCHERAHEEDE